MFDLPWQIDWITCAPKTKPSSLKVEFYHELKVVIGINDEVPLVGDHEDRYNYPVKKKQLWLSPVNTLDHTRPIGTQTSSSINKDSLQHCIQLIKTNPRWKLNTQSHKYWGVE